MKISDLENYSITIYDVKDQLKQFIYSKSIECINAGEKCRDAIKNKDQVKARQKFIREKFIDAIGGIPVCDAPLNAKIRGVIKNDGFTIEKIIFESRENAFVTCNLYLPDGIDSPRGAVLFLSGHHDLAKLHPEYQSVCQYLVKSGLIVLAMDPPGQGERLNYYEERLKDSIIGAGTREHDYVGSQCFPVGHSLARYFVHDAMRAVDYLCTRREVDKTKIGVTGNSGGGTQTSLMMICEPRIAAAAPATFIMNRKEFMLSGQAQDAEQIWPGMTELGFDHEDILLMMAPRPVRVLAVKYDFFPIEATRQTVDRAKRFWGLFEKSKGIDLVEDDSIHCYTEVLAKSAAEFFSKHLLGQVNPHLELKGTLLNPAELACTASGQIRGEIEGAYTLFDENYIQLGKLEKSRQSLDKVEHKEKALLWLRDKIYTHRHPCALNPRLFMLKGYVDEFMVYNALWRSQEGLFNYGIIFRDYRYQDEELPLTIAVWDGGTSQIQRHLKWLRKTCSMGRAVMVLDVSGVGSLLPNSLISDTTPNDFYGVIHKLTDDLIWLNDSMVALRSYDVLRSVEMVEYLPDIKKEEIHLYGNGRQGLYAQLAAVLDERVENLEVEQGMESIAEYIKSRFYNHLDIMSLVLPGMLKYFDLPDLLRWIAERKD